MRILASADIHGNTRVVQWIAELAGERGADTIVLAGDLLGEPEGHRTGEEAQRQSARDLLEILERGRTPVLYVTGNDDLVELEPLTSHCRSLHGRRVTLGGYHFAGYQYSLPFACTLQ